MLDVLFVVAFVCYLCYSVLYFIQDWQVCWRRVFICLRLCGMRNIHLIGILTQTMFRLDWVHYFWRIFQKSKFRLLAILEMLLDHYLWASTHVWWQLPPPPDLHLYWSDCFCVDRMLLGRSHVFSPSQWQSTVKSCSAWVKLQGPSAPLGATSVSKC